MYAKKSKFTFCFLIITKQRSIIIYYACRIINYFPQCGSLQPSRQIYFLHISSWPQLNERVYTLAVHIKFPNRQMILYLRNWDWNFLSPWGESLVRVSQRVSLYMKADSCISVGIEGPLYRQYFPRFHCWLQQGDHQPYGYISWEWWCDEVTD